MPPLQPSAESHICLNNKKKEKEKTEMQSCFFKKITIHKHYLTYIDKSMNNISQGYREAVVANTP